MPTCYTRERNDGTKYVTCQDTTKAALLRGAVSLDSALGAMNQGLAIESVLERSRRMRESRQAQVQAMKTPMAPPKPQVPPKPEFVRHKPTGKNYKVLLTEGGAKYIMRDGKKTYVSSLGKTNYEYGSGRPLR